MSIRKQPQPAKGAKRLSWKANLLFAAVIDYLYDVGSYVVHLQVKDGTISFQDSQCPDHVCEQFGQLSEEGAWAACVPAGVYVQLAPLSEAEAAS